MTSDEVPRESGHDARLSARFELRGRLGEGGMGTVHRAHDRLYGREVALKVGRTIGDARIGDEFALLASLDHVGCVRVLDFGLSGETAWLSSEIVRGPRLDVWAARDRGNGEDGALEEVTRELIDTLGWLHAQGLVHGDIKPANVLVGARGPVLIDFGLAGRGETLFGATRAYAAPELLRGEPPSAASDAFALGRTIERAMAARGSRSERLARLCARLTEERAEARAELEEARAIVSDGRETEASGATTKAWWTAAARRDGGGAAGVQSWTGAVERAIQVLERTHVAVEVADDGLRAGFFRALAARLMLAGRAAWILPRGAGLAPFARVAAALGLGLEEPQVIDADDQKEVLDAFADRLIDLLREVEPEARPVLLVPELGALGAAGRFLLARLVEAAALPAFVIAAGERLERGVADAFERVRVLESEVAGRDWIGEWRALPDEAREVARELWGLGGAARIDELSMKRARAGLIALSAAGLTERAAVGRTALRAEVIEALDGLSEALAVAPTSEERRRWLGLLVRLEDASEAMWVRSAEHARALGERAHERAALTKATALAERELAWERAARWRLDVARVELDDRAPGAAAEAALGALKALWAAGGGPLADEALAVLDEALAAIGGQAAPELVGRAKIARARAHGERGDGVGAAAEASAALSWVRANAAGAWRLELEALLVRGAALARGDDKAGAERDLGAAAALAETHADLHALGRAANNLGMLAFHRGDLAAAADAWARAAEAKRQTGDRRGERIGRHNRGLALRELGRLEEAAQAADEAAALAERIGDRIGQATANLARAQLALDAGRVEAAERALHGFEQVAWKPAMVEGDGRLVRARLCLAKAEPEAASEEARRALTLAIERGLEPLAAEAWALGCVAERRGLEAPALVEGALGRARHERGGLACLLVCAGALADAEAGRWSEAREALAWIAERIAGGVPPAARVGIGLAVAAARLVEPGAVAWLERAAGGDARGDGREDGAARGPEAVLDLGAWAARVKALCRASRVEIVPRDGEVVIANETLGAAGAGAARFVELGRRIARSGERFVGRDASGRPEAIGVALAVGTEVVGALVAAFDGGDGAPEALEAGAGREALGGVALVVALVHERRRRERAEGEVTRLARELDEALARHEAEVTSLRDALEQSQSALSLRHEYGEIVHRSAAMRRVLTTLDKVTDRELPVLILGESGVGKELLARALHFNGPRKKARFVAENCGAIPKDLFESQFFGHVKGAFTGALQARQGLFEIAQGGTLFLDEVGELPLEMQVKLLRVLQDRVVRPVGSNREVAVDFRLVCATNRDLAQMVSEGRFREDLFYRIAVVKVDVPPLRKRPEDIVPIAERLLKVHGERMGRSVRLTPEAADRLAAYAFPGNVRELDNEIMRALALTDGNEIRVRHLSAAIQGRSEPKRRGGGAEGELEPLEAAVMRVERDMLIRHLRASAGQKVKAAKTLGLSRPGLDAKLVRHGIDVKELARSLKEPTR